MVVPTQEEDKVRKRTNWGSGRKWWPSPWGSTSPSNQGVCECVGKKCVWSAVMIFKRRAVWEHCSVQTVSNSEIITSNFLRCRFCLFLECSATVHGVCTVVTGVQTLVGPISTWCWLSTLYRLSCGWFLWGEDVSMDQVCSEGERWLLQVFVLQYRESLIHGTGLACANRCVFCGNISRLPGTIFIVTYSYKEVGCCHLSLI